VAAPPAVFAVLLVGTCRSFRGRGSEGGAPGGGWLRGTGQAARDASLMTTDNAVIVTTTTETATNIITTITIADRINEQYRLAEQSKATAVQHAIRCGQLLLEQQDALNHGEFMPWVKKDCKFEYSTAARYMKAARQISTGVEISSLSALFPSGRAASIKTAKNKKVMKALEVIEHDDADDDVRDVERVAEDSQKVTELPQPSDPIQADQHQSLAIDEALQVLRRAVMNDTGMREQSLLVSKVGIAQGNVTKLRNKLQAAEKILANAEAAAIAEAEKIKAVQP
jgi:hypothetical protein